MTENATAEYAGAGTGSADRAELLKKLLSLKGIHRHRAESIPRRDEDSGAPELSFAQQRLWFLDQLEPGSSAYNIPAAVRLSGALDVRALSRALAEVVRRHESLRTTFKSVGGQPVQVIAPPAPVELPVTDLSTLEDTEREERARELTEREAARPFDLSAGPLLRVQLVRLGEDAQLLLLTMHHIVSDGWSMQVLVRELTALYDAYSRGEESPLAELPIQYADYAAWQRRRLQGEYLESQLSYWRAQLAGAPPAIELPTDGARPRSTGPRGGAFDFVIDEELTASLEELGRREGATLFMTLLAAFQTLLHRYSGQDDIVVGTPVANRNRAELEPLIGFFVNQLALRADFAGGPTFRELLGQVRGRCLSAYAHQDVPFERVVEELRPERNLSHNPIFQVAFMLQNVADAAGDGAPASRPAQEDETAGRFRQVTTKFDLTLGLAESGGRLTGTFEYSRDLFDESRTQHFAEHYTQLLKAVASDPDVRVQDVPLLSESERRLISAWNETGRPYPSELCTHELFEAQAAYTPDAVAVVFGAELLTYRELNERADRFARRLGAHGVGPEVVVGILLERSVELVVALLGVLKAGGAYLPLDPSYPQERLRYILEDSRARLVITQQSLVALAQGSSTVIRLDSDDWLLDGEEDAEPAHTACAQNLAYVIYTSGSTGRPKGVEVSHRALVNFLSSMAERPGLDSSDTLLAVTPLSFDIAGLELYLPLTRGARLALATHAEAHDPVLLTRSLESSAATLMQATPSTWRMLLESGWGGARHLRALCGGEPLTARLAAQLGGECAALWNMYGPTETTIWSTAEEVAGGGEAGGISIGRPIDNTQVYVLDRWLRAVPPGVTGELYIGGDGLARGYLGRPALTAERFVPDPFAAEPGARLYRTGDVGRHLTDGRLECVGRVDNQVKVRGHRIELGEVEAALLLHPLVRAAVVAARAEADGGRRLVGYVVADETQALGAAELRAYLRERLPEYMVPSAFVTLDALPLTPNGKIDRKALPEPDAAPAADSYVAPRTPAEELVCGLFSRVLGVEPVGARDNFFERGGHSLLATQLVSRVREAFGVELPLRELFEGPTPSALARKVESAVAGGNTAALDPVTPTPREGELELSFAQQRLWFLDQLEPDSAAYNIPAGVRLTGALDVEALTRALNEVVRRHESLRTSFPSVGGRPVQVIAPATPVELPITDLSTVGEESREAESRRLLASWGGEPFDLSAGPLLRVRLVKMGGESHVLLVCMHHVISDGWSMQVLVNELTTLYSAFSQGQPSPLAELPVQYADYAAWQRRLLQGELLESQLSYWRAQLAGAPPAIELPTDRARPRTLSPRGAKENFQIPAALTAALTALGRREGATLFMTLMAAFQTLLHRCSGQDDIVVGVPVAGRRQLETEALVGLFVNTLALRTDLSGDPGFDELLRRVREATLAAYANQDVPFERIVEELRPERSLGRAPLYQVLFTLQNERASADAGGGTQLAFTPLGLDSDTTKYELALYAEERGGELFCSLVYSTELFEPETVRRLAAQYLTLLEGVSEEPRRPLSQLPLSNAASQAGLLADFNGGF